MISKYISDKEYECPCCSQLPVAFNYDDICMPMEALFNSFDAIREEWGKPIPISSGYRCSQYNEKIGGSRLSAHVFGLALDCDVDNVDEVKSLVTIIEQLFPNLRRGEYTDSGTFIHLDVAYFIYPKASHSWVDGYRWFG